jgi:3-dehydroquinate dehydratase-1
MAGMARPEVRLGNLTLGDTPRVVGTVSLPETLARPGRFECDIVELRLDLLSGNALRSLAQPVIATVRLACEGGKWTRPDAERLALFETALRQCEAADIEYRSGLLEKVSVLAAQHRKPLIVSYHDFERTPSLAELREVVSRAARFGAIVKVATLTRTEADLQTLRELLAMDCPAALCVLGMGPLAAVSREEFPRLGSCLVYGYLDAPVAPGQPAARDLMRR